MKISYDLHMHSCLSPCGDNDMTPNNIVNMALLLGLDAIAVSDHNSAKNLPAVLAASSAAAAADELDEPGILVVPAIEVCTSEEVHILCLFEELCEALTFGEDIYDFLPDMKNDTQAFGDQLIMDENDEIIGREDKLLINALTISIDKLLPMVKKRNGLAIPAHVDKSANSIIASLGLIPKEYGFECIEIKNPPKEIDFDGNRITNSDAHQLELINEPKYFLEVTEKSAKGIIEALRKKA